jgi:hypothetical protein
MENWKRTNGSSHTTGVRHRYQLLFRRVELGRCPYRPARVQVLAPALGPGRSSLPAPESVMDMVTGLRITDRNQPNPTSILMAIVLDEGSFPSDLDYLAQARMGHSLALLALPNGCHRIHLYRQGWWLPRCFSRPSRAKSVKSTPAWIQHHPSSYLNLVLCK